MTGFGLAVVTLGTFVVGTFGLGGLAIKVGAKAVKTIAQSIVDAAWIFKGAEGAFTGGPKKEWAEGVSLALGAFSPIYAMMLRSGIIDALFGGGGVSPDDYASAIRTISQGVVDAGKFFGSKEANVAFTGGPKKEWAEGVGKAIGAFAPVYKMLFDSKNANFWTGKKGPTMESYVAAIKTISRGIIASAKIFAGSKVGYGKGTYPSAEWGRGVGAALQAFAPVFKSMSGSWFQGGESVVNDMVYGVKMLSYAIVKVGKIFAWSKLKWDVNTIPGKEWIGGIKNAIMSYVNLSSFILNSDYAPSSLQDDNVIKIGRSLVDFANEIKKGGDAFQVKIDPDYMKNMSSNIFYYMAIANKLTKETSMKSLLKNAVFGDPISNIATSMMKLAIAYDKMGSSLMKFNRAVNQLDEKKINTFKGLNSNMIGRAEKGLGASVSGAVGNVVSGAGNLVGGVLNSLTSLVTPKSDKRSNMPKKDESKGKYGTLNQQMDKLVDVVKQLTENTKSLEKYIQEKLNEDDDPKKRSK